MLPTACCLVVGCGLGLELLVSDLFGVKLRPSHKRTNKQTNVRKTETIATGIEFRAL